MSVPESLADEALQPLWSMCRVRLERFGLDHRGRLNLKPLTSRGKYLLTGLLDVRQVGATVSLLDVETALVSRGIGSDLALALAELGSAVSPEPGRRRDVANRAAQSRLAARDLSGAWPEPWAASWADEIIRAGAIRGLDAAEVAVLLRQTRTVIDRIGMTRDAGPDANGLTPLSRVELAAVAAGSAHALDPGTRLEAAVSRALRHVVGDEQSTDLWRRAGVHNDLVSAPALTWNLPATGGLEPLIRAATSAGLPLHLHQFGLRRARLCVAAGTVVHVMENPRLVEAAAQRGSGLTVISTNGNPSAAVRLLVDQLLDCGAALRYHGDFDAAGLAICARMQRIGMTPWKMDTDDYEAAVRSARSAGVPLPLDPAQASATPWDPSLQAAFNTCREVVHEERLIDDLLD